MKKLVAFDLDGTLAESKQAIQPDMAALLAQMTQHVPLAVISGGDWPQFEKQIVARLPADAKLENLFIMPTTGTKLYRYDGEWKSIYADVFSPDEHDRILKALDDAMRTAGFADQQTWGEKIEDRGSQITFSGLGQDAPIDAKKAWDPDFAKRKKLQQILQGELKGFAINVGGSTSIDITREGTDKATAMTKLADHSGISTADMIFLGDAIYPGGNDDPVRAAGIDTIKVRDPEETMTALRGMLAFMG
ncbi:HAD-IIB family hydrolase [Sphingomonas aliaeris]|uniref:phosphomannomutase n=1 Tax=Sphingomonas aliaeris TaxID=2759526 RepID=A0A974S555_9SPHN|nr:HAD-IIB family hydrolase [Sphingomonas aliaeris]QQV78204.1 HAD-IIB family hydrolase [Sphingomonas aliaeris]